jgi:hypothetical protein
LGKARKQTSTNKLRALELAGIVLWEITISHRLDPPALGLFSLALFNLFMKYHIVTACVGLACLQVVGKKRWHFMDGRYSAYMHPLRGGMSHMTTGIPTMAEYHPHLPLSYADVVAGDLLYNPDWQVQLVP